MGNMGLVEESSDCLYTSLMVRSRSCRTAAQSLSVSKRSVEVVSFSFPLPYCCNFDTDKQ